MSEVLRGEKYAAF